MTVVNYMILVGYDYLAVRHVGEPLGLGKIALASFTGYACSYNIGATIAGTSIRYRLYSAWGMSSLRILQLLVILGLTFWFGVFALAGVIFVADPPHVPVGNHAELAGQLHHAAHHTTDELVRGVVDTLNWLSDYMRPLGVVLLLVAAAYVIMSAAHTTLDAYVSAHPKSRLKMLRDPASAPLKADCLPDRNSLGRLAGGGLGAAHAHAADAGDRLPKIRGHLHGRLCGGGAEPRARRAGRAGARDTAVSAATMPPGRFRGADRIPGDLLLGAISDRPGLAGDT